MKTMMSCLFADVALIWFAMAFVWGFMQIVFFIVFNIPVALDIFHDLMVRPEGVRSVACYTDHLKT